MIKLGFAFKKDHQLVASCEINFRLLILDSVNTPVEQD